MTSYVAGSTCNDAHRVGKRALSDVMNSASSMKHCVKRVKKTFDVENRPKGKTIANVRNKRACDIFARLDRYENAGSCFRELVHMRRQNCLQGSDKWFDCENTFFADKDEKFFVGFLRINPAYLNSSAFSFRLDNRSIV